MISEEVKKQPIYYGLIILLLFIAMVSLPSTALLTKIFGENDYRFLSPFVFRPIFVAGFIIFAVKIGLGKYFITKPTLKSLIFVLPVLIIAINNFPFFSYFSNKLAINSNRFEIGYILATFMIVFSEEIVFRLIILPLTAIKLKTSRFYQVKVVAVSSAIFALTHIVNLFGGAGFVSVLLQVLYSFGLGAGLNLIMIKTGNIFIATGVHLIYNLGGSILTYGLVYGMMWTVGQIILTTIIAVIFGLIIIFMIFNTKNEEITQTFNLES